MCLFDGMVFALGVDDEECVRTFCKARKATEPFGELILFALKPDELELGVLFSKGTGFSTGS